MELVYRIYMYNYYEIFSPSFIVYSVLFPGCVPNLNKETDKLDVQNPNEIMSRQTKLLYSAQFNY